MNNYIFSKWQHYFVMIILGVIIFTACKDNEVINPLTESPEVPGITSMQMDFDNFPSAGSLPKIAGNFGSDKVLTKGNVGWAALNVVIWQSLVKLGMVIPVAAFLESFNHDPELQEDGRWLWTYEFTPQGGVKHTASLYAEVSLTNVKWEMYVSKENEFTDFQWFSGESNLSATDGTWTLNHHPNDPSPWVGIEWHRNPEDSTGNIKYTNIQWYRTTHEGQVKDSLHFGDNDWHCWDANLEDTECP